MKRETTPLRRLAILTGRGGTPSTGESAPDNRCNFMFRPKGESAPDDGGNSMSRESTHRCGRQLLLRP